MTSASPTAFSWRGLLQTLFDVEDAALGSAASPLAAAQTPGWSRRSDRLSASSARSPSASSVSSAAAEIDDTTEPYAPSRLDGEFNVWFARKPLGLGLVPSTQLYGTWEISSVSQASSSSSSSIPPPSRDEVAERAKIQVGDVVIAVNFNTRLAKLPRDAFASYLQHCACPVVVTLRRPALYGTFDSRALSTAMFPASIEYRGRDADLDHKTFLARAPSMQWQRSLQHELKHTKARHKKSTNKSDKLVKRTDPEPNPDAVEPTPEADPLLGSSSSASDTAAHETDDATRRRALSTADLTAMGEYTTTFHDIPLGIELAPSTRLYGSIEVSDPKDYAPLVQVGDVIMEVNGEPSVAKWPTDDALDHIAALDAPVIITFRRPAAYRKYLETYFKLTHSTVNSHSTATAMFPDSAEYRPGHYRDKKKAKASPTQQRRGSLTHRRTSTPSLSTTHRHGDRTDRKTSTPTIPTHQRDRVEGQGRMTKAEWLQVSKQLSSSDQFKLWQSAASKRQSSKAKKTGAAEAWLHTSAFLTERHVHYLWSHLPEYLTCNDMELVYDTRRHGWNLLSFYSRVEDKGPTLLVVKDTHDQIFGAFSSTSWKQSTDVYGNGRCFVFSLRPQMKVYSWSGLNDTFMYGRRDSIMMGGGKKGIALCLQIDELRGFSHACETFDSPSLVPVSVQGGSFDMENIEVWCFSGLRV